ncbi:MAG: hypothetical protein JNK67_14765 [Alphaproteobacteria bacterium]|nr:hypothetical protein [Alphaproteobacteria bacterium]
MPHGPALAVLLAVLLAVTAAGAQQPEREPERLQRDRTTTREAEDAATRARERRAFEGPTIGFQDVLRDPDNLELNLGFVRQQIRDGDLRGAASTLERILALAPGLAEARVLHAIVLFRLDSTVEAERELRGLANLDLPPGQRAEVDGYLRQIERRRQAVRWQASLSVGGQAETNRDATPSGKERLVVDLPLTVRRGHSDAAVLAVAQLRMTYDLGTPDGHEFFAVATSFRNRQRHLSQFDLGADTLEAGFNLRTDLADVSPSLVLGYGSLMSRRFQRSVGGRVRAERQFGDVVSFFADTLAQYQHFDAVTRTRNGDAAAPRANELSGLRVDAEFGLAFNLDAEHRLSASYTRTRKAAQRDYNAYVGDQAALRHTWLLGDGRFLLASATAERDLFDGADTLVSARTRRDTVLRGQIGYGTPLNTLARGALPDWAGDITLLASVDVIRSISNLPNYTYTNLRGQLMLTKLWEF